MENTLKTIIETETGKVLFATELDEFDLLESQTIVYEILTENFNNPHYDFETQTFYDKLE